RGLHGGDLGQRVDGRVDHRGDRFAVPVLSESVSKSACAFPTRSNAALVWASSASAFSARARSCAISRACARARPSPPAPSPAPLVVVPAAASAALRHSAICDEYRRSRRRIAPRSSRSAASYSATIATLYSAVKVRRLARSALGVTAPSSVTPASANVMV